MGGPVGAAVGGVAGAVIGGLAGKGAAVPAYTADADLGNLDQGDVAQALDELLESCRDGEYGFKTSADNADSPDLKAIFMRHSAECRAAAQELEAQIHQLGKKPSSGGTLTGALHRGWVSVRTALTSQDDKAVLEECERGEDSAVAQYRKALKQPLPASIRAIVERQAQGAQRNHDEVRDLRDRYRSAS